MKDKEIVKALECCEFKGNCLDCPMNHYKDGICSNEMLKSALDLINRLQTKNDRLEHQLETLCFALKTVKAEAYKEFAERLKTIAINRYNEFDEQEYPRATITDIDNLLKELLGDKP